MCNDHEVEEKKYVCSICGEEKPFDEMADVDLCIECQQMVIDEE